MDSRQSLEQIKLLLPAVEARWRQIPPITKLQSSVRCIAQAVAL